MSRRGDLALNEEQINISANECVGILPDRLRRCCNRNGCAGGAHLSNAAGDQLWANRCGIQISERALHRVGGRRNDGGVLGGGIFVAEPEPLKIDEGE